ncbi:MAG: hypothetical protein QOJ93_3022, partial [Actinomycetota bacterium]|nr:hypothetical protein [Actinomycetota bacterium]
AAGLRCELKFAGRSGHGVPAQSGAKARLYTCGECGLADTPDGRCLHPFCIGHRPRLVVNRA